MAYVIHKHRLKVTDRQTILAPAALRSLSVHNQDGTLCLWAAVDDEAKYAEHEIFVVGTGSPAGHVAGRQFVGTVFLDGDVWHVFYGGPAWPS